MPDKQGQLLENLTWVEAEQALTPEAIVVIPLGAAAKEHGPHLRLNNDLVLAEFLKQKVLSEADVVVAPTISHFYYPSFVEYPGTVSVNLDTAKSLVVDICLSLSAFGPRRFYVINTGVSTLKALLPAKELLAKAGITLSFTDFLQLVEPVVIQISEQEGGSHADEIETSIMLYIAPERVDMSKAAKDYQAPKDCPDESNAPLTRTRQPGRPFSPSGIWGDATLATPKKGELVVQSLVKGILKDIDDLRQTSAPAIGSD